MLNTKTKTFFNCYFYALSNEKGNVVENDILEYVTQAQRINYADASFKNIRDQLKTRSTSAVLYRILQRGDIALCIYKKELPSSFKVFTAKDKRAVNASKKTVFIDATELIEFQNGQFYCKDIDRLATYLTGALVQMIYYTDTIKLTGNANLQKSSVSAFVKMFARVMDYLKVNNYLQNRERILYIAGVYFAYSVIGMDIESARRVSAVVNHVNPMDQKMHDDRYIEDDFTNIDTFISSITRTFNLVGMNTSVFANKWLYIFGKGTIYALELYPVFLQTIMYAYAGTYINNWKAIESTCGKDMVDIATIVFKIGGDMFNRGFSYEAAVREEIKEKLVALKPANGFVIKSIDDEDYKNENYNLENELSGLLEVEQNGEVPDNQQEKEATNQADNKKNEEAPTNNQQQSSSNQNVKDAQEQLRQQNEAAEKELAEIRALKEDLADKKRGPFDVTKFRKYGIEIKPDEIWQDVEGRDLVDKLDKDNYMAEALEAERKEAEEAEKNQGKDLVDELDTQTLFGDVDW